jgi:hypothetical protein
VAIEPGGQIKDIYSICSSLPHRKSFCSLDLRAVVLSVTRDGDTEDMLSVAPLLCVSTWCVWCIGKVACEYTSVRKRVSEGDRTMSVGLLSFVLSVRMCSKCRPTGSVCPVVQQGNALEIMNDFVPMTQCIAALRANAEDTEWLRDFVPEPTFHCTRLPDLVCLTSYVSWNVEVFTRYKIPMLHLLSKLPPCRCLFRGWTQAVVRYVREQDAVRQTLQHMLGSSLLGLYPWSTVDQFSSAEGMYRIASDILRLDKTEVFIEFVESFPHVLFYAAKEALLYYTRLNHALRATLAEVYSLENFESDIIRWSHQMRTSLVESGANSNRWEVTERLAKRFSTTSTYVHKLIKLPFHRCVSATLKKIGVVTCKHPEMRSTIARICSRVSISEIEANVAELLYCSGTSRRFGIFISEMLLAYLHGSISNNRMQRALEKWSFDEMSILFTLFSCAQRVDFIEQMPVTAELYRKQRRALQMRYAIKDVHCTMRLQEIFNRQLAHCVDKGQTGTSQTGAQELRARVETLTSIPSTTVICVCVFF